MWWLLRRARLTGVALFQSSSNNNNSATKPETRPRRKNYVQLSSNEKLDNASAGTGAATVAAGSDSETSDAGTCEPCTAHDRANNNLPTAASRDDLTDDTDYDEALTCNVCDRAFPCRRQLQDHKQKKRHFGCSACDSLFPSLMALEHHKEEFQHWSEEDDYFSDDSEASDESVPSEDCERLL